MGIDFEKADRVAQRIAKNISTLIEDGRTAEQVISDFRSILEEEFKESPSRLKPVSPHIFIKDLSPQEVKSQAGLYIPGNKTQQDLQRARVLSVPNEIIGKKGVRRPCTVQPGMVILYEKCFGVEIEIEGESFVLLEERHVVAEMAEG